MSGDSVSLAAEGLTACSDALSAVAGELTSSAATAAHAESALAGEAFGVAGSAFVGAFHALVTQHTSTIRDLAATVASMSHTAATTASAYRDTDEHNADALARTQWSPESAGRTSAAAAGDAGEFRRVADSFDRGYRAAAVPLDGTGSHEDGFGRYGSGSLGAFTERSTLDGTDIIRPAGAATLTSAVGHVRLPGGLGLVDAPNPRAAAAVRAALTQLGVPYRWGGASPGAALDCSGLTQFAYRQAGIDLPHFAADQRVGRFLGTDPGEARPGDLAVWDQHVAMVIGNGQMIEAGNPVQITPIRTSNVVGGHADTFYGFYRPTEGG